MFCHLIEPFASWRRDRIEEDMLPPLQSYCPIYWDHPIGFLYGLLSPVMGHHCTGLHPLDGSPLSARSVFDVVQTVHSIREIRGQHDVAL